MKGKNLFNLTESQRISLGTNRPCIFICHQHKDKPVCRKIASYLRNAGVDVFFDEEDQQLQVAVQKRDPFGITRRIKEGIESSSHMLCVVSQNTSESKWVPFEIGYGHAKLVLKNANRDSVSLIRVSTLILRDLAKKDLPEYMQVTYVMKDIHSINEYVAKLRNTSTWILENRGELKSHNDYSHPLATDMYQII